MTRRAKVFICYAQEDTKLCKELRASLSSALWMDDPQFEVWHDGEIPAGSDWRAEIRANLQQADIFVILLSKWLLDSKFVRETEFAVIEQRRNRDECSVIVVPTAPLELRGTPFERIQAALTRPLTADRRDNAWPEVVRAVQDAASRRTSFKMDETRKNTAANVHGDHGLADVIPLRRSRSHVTTVARDGEAMLDRIRHSLHGLPSHEDPGWASFQSRLGGAQLVLSEGIRSGALSPWTHEQALVLHSALNRLTDPSTTPDARSRALDEARRAASVLLSEGDRP